MLIKGWLGVAAAEAFWGDSCQEAWKMVKFEAANQRSASEVMFVHDQVDLQVFLEKSLCIEFLCHNWKAAASLPC